MEFMNVSRISDQKGCQVNADFLNWTKPTKYHVYLLVSVQMLSIDSYFKLLSYKQIVIKAIWIIDWI